MRLSEARQRLEAQQAEAAGRTANRAATPQQPPPPPLASEPSDVSLSAPVTLNDKQHRTAAALLASLGQTANRGRERLARLERVLNTIAADAAEPQKVRVDKVLTLSSCLAATCFCHCVLFGVIAVFATFMLTAARRKHQRHSSRALPSCVQAQAAYAAMSQLSRELLELQQSQSDFGAALEAVGTRGELLEVKRRLEGHQVRHN